MDQQAQSDGFADGFEREYARGLNRALQILAKRMLAKSYSVAEIAELTGLPQVQVRKLKKNRKK
jgi:hypothetical protein